MMEQDIVNRLSQHFDQVPIDIVETEIACNKYRKASIFEQNKRSKALTSLARLTHKRH